MQDDIEEHEALSQPSDRRVASVFERHVQTGLLTIIVAGVVWAGGRLNDTSDAVLRLQTSQNTLQVEVTRLQDKLDRDDSDRYRAKDAERDFGRIEKRIDAMELQLRQRQK